MFGSIKNDKLFPKKKKKFQKNKNIFKTCFPANVLK